MSDLMVIEKTLEQLAKDDLVRQTLEAAAQKIEMQAGNEIYQAAWKTAAKIIRSLKPL